MLSQSSLHTSEAIQANPKVEAGKKLIPIGTEFRIVTAVGEEILVTASDILDGNILIAKSTSSSYRFHYGLIEDYINNGTIVVVEKGESDLIEGTNQNESSYQFYLQMFNINEGDTFTESTASEIFNKVLDHLLFIHRKNTQEELEALLKVVNVVLENIKTDGVSPHSPLFSAEYWNDVVRATAIIFDSEKAKYFSHAPGDRYPNEFKRKTALFKHVIINNQALDFSKERLWKFFSVKENQSRPITVTYLNSLGEVITATGIADAVGEDYILLNGVSIRPYSIINLEVSETPIELTEGREKITESDQQLSHDDKGNTLTFEQYNSLPMNESGIILYPVTITYRNGDGGEHKVSGKPSMAGSDYIVVKGIRISRDQIIDMTLIEI
jgi:hypothetical protein